jgi:hypothetical protein
MHEHDNLEGIRGTFNAARQMFPTISYQAKMVAWQISEGNLDLRSQLYKAHIVPNDEKNQALAAIHSQTLPAKNTLKYY